MMGELPYIDYEYVPKKDDVVVLFYVEPEKVDMEVVANHIAAESSIGTWTDVVTMKKERAEKLKARVFYIDKKRNLIKVAYPLDLFEITNISQVLSSIAGNIFGMKVVKNLRLLDVSFPPSFIKKYRGPRYGIEGVRKLFKVRNRPLIGTIVKPKLGLKSKEHALVAYDAWLGGVDIVKDDENLADMKFNRFEKRLKETMKMKEKAERETGEKKGYMINITAPYREMIRRAKLVEEYGNEYVMLDIISIGWSALQSFIEEGFKFVVHAHRAGHAALTKNKKHGISMLFIAKLSRMVGVDQLHVGTANVGKMESKADEVVHIQNVIQNRDVPESIVDGVLAQEWMKIKPVFAVASGGLHPGSVPKLVEIMGKDIIIQFGGGIHGHPRGTRAGATAVRQAIEATEGGVSLEEYAKTHKELRIAIKKWGVVK